MILEKLNLASQFTGSRLLHSMLRVSDLDRSLEFYVGTLGMRLLRRQDFTQGSYTLAFVGYAAEDEGSVLELTYNWDKRTYQKGDAFGHLAIQVDDVQRVTTILNQHGVPVSRPAGPLPGAPDEWIAFIEDPDGYRIELIQVR